MKDNYRKAYESLLKKYDIVEKITERDKRQKKKAKEKHVIIAIAKAFIFSFHSEYIEQYLNKER